MQPIFAFNFLLLLFLKCKLISKKTPSYTLVHCLKLYKSLIYFVYAKIENRNNQFRTKKLQETFNTVKLRVQCEPINSHLCSSQKISRKAMKRQICPLVSKLSLAKLSQVNNSPPENHKKLMKFKTKTHWVPKKPVMRSNSVFGKTVFYQPGAFLSRLKTCFWMTVTYTYPFEHLSSAQFNLVRIRITQIGFEFIFGKNIEKM